MSVYINGQLFSSYTHRPPLLEGLGWKSAAPIARAEDKMSSSLTNGPLGHTILSTAGAGASVSSQGTKELCAKGLKMEEARAVHVLLKTARSRLQRRVWHKTGLP